MAMAEEYSQFQLVNVSQTIRLMSCFDDLMVYQKESNQIQRNKNLT